MVRDKVITGAVRQAYRRCMPAAVHPVVILFLEMPFDQVDVNAHPAKIEIRFHNQRDIFDLVQETIERAISRGAGIPEFEAHGERTYPMEQSWKQKAYSGNAEAVSATASLYYPSVSESQSDTEQRVIPLPPSDKRNEYPRPGANHAGLRIHPEMLLDSDREEGEALLAGPVRILGQYRNSYIIASDGKGLLIIDQHVAHERILYENLANSMKNREVETQGLLDPLTIDLAPQQKAFIEKVMPELRRNGFHVESFGGASIIVRSVPAITGETDYRELLKEILEDLDVEDRGMDIDVIRDRIAVSTACRAAVKINTPLTMEKMQWLIDQLARTKIPTSCPHGRPIILRFSNYEIEKKFGRL